MRVCVFAALAAVVAFVSLPDVAEAGRYGHRHKSWHSQTWKKAYSTHAHRGYRGKRVHRSRLSSRARARSASGYPSYAASASSGSYGAGPRPKKWCGWWMRTQRGGGPALNVAWNWSKWGSASGPQVGAVAVWRHHVGEIVGQAGNGKWLVRSGNYGGGVKTRAMSLKGAVFRTG